MTQSPQAKGKETMSVQLSEETPPKTKKLGASNQEFKFFPNQNSFRKEQVVAIFHLLQKGNKLKLPEARHPNKIGRTNDPNYCLFYRMVHHLPTTALSLRTKFRLWSTLEF